MSNATRVLQVASREVGYSRWNDPLEGTKYGRWYRDVLKKGSYYGTSGVPCAIVQHNGHVWRNDHSAGNAWEPGTTGAQWADLGPIEDYNN